MPTFLQKIEAEALKVENAIKVDLTEVQPFIVTAISVTQKIDALLRSNLAVVAGDLIPNGQADREILLAIIDEAVIDLKAVQSAKSYDGILQALATGISEIIHGKKLTWSQYLIAVEQVFAKVFGSSKPAVS